MFSNLIHLLPFALSLLLTPSFVCGLSGDASTFFGGIDNDSYLEWLSRHQDSNYSSAYFTSASNDDQTQGAAVHWKVDAENEVVYLAVAARATGWLGFGLAEAGGMRGSDMVIYESSNPDKLTDAYVLGELASPLVDDCQDWTLINVTSDGGFLIFEGKRKFVTGDSQDHEIFKDDEVFLAAQRVIVAWGDTETRSFHGDKNVKGALRWFGDGDELSNFRKLMDEKADGHFDLLVGNYTVPAERTTYVDFCLGWSDVVQQGIPESQGTISMIGIETLDGTEGARFVHHASIFGSETESISGTCLEPVSLYGSIYYSWTPGELPSALPENVGYTMGPQGTVQSFLLNFHYDNRNFEQGATHNGGFRLYYTLKQQPVELGILPLADAVLKLKGVPISDGYSGYEFTCSPECSTFALGDEPVTVIKEYLHMHESAKLAVQQHFRDGKELRRSEVNYWDYSQTGLFAPRQRPFQILPGDSFKTSCYFYSTGNLTFGPGAQDEMCEGFIVYYPAKKVLGDSFPWVCMYDLPFITSCSAQMEIIAGVSDERSLVSERSFGLSDGQCSNDNNTKTERSGGLRKIVTLTSIISCFAFTIFF